MKRGKWIRVPLLLMLALTLAVPAVAQLVVNNSETPGSVLVFHKILPGTVTINSERVPRTEIEISVACPPGAVCPEQWPPSPNRRVKLLAHWVCPGSQKFEDKLICKETNFILQTTINGTIRLDANGNVFPPQATATGSGRIPVPPNECADGGYLIVWVINEFDFAISFNGLIGNAVLREIGGASAYNAVPVQSPLLLNVATDVNLNNALDFNGIEYALLTGKIYGTVRYDNIDGSAPIAATALTLLTLDVISNASNYPTFVAFNFYNEREEVVSTSVEFICWTQVMLSDINTNLTEAGMGSRKGLFESSPAQKRAIGGITDVAGPVTLLGIIETAEVANGNNVREYSYSTYNDPLSLVPTIFFPTFVGPLP